MNVFDDLAKVSALRKILAGAAVLLVASLLPVASATAHVEVISAESVCSDTNRPNFEAAPGSPEISQEILSTAANPPSAHVCMFNTEYGSFNLNEEIPGFGDRHMRLRFWIMEPGGVIMRHRHIDRPAYVYLLQGQVYEVKLEPPEGQQVVLNEGRSCNFDSRTPTVNIITGGSAAQSKPGEAALEDNCTEHWWYNLGKLPVLMVAVDVPNESATNLNSGIGLLLQELLADARRRVAPQSVAVVGNSGVSAEQLGAMALSSQYPGLAAVKDYVLTGQIVAIQPNGSFDAGLRAGRPGIAFVLDGTLLEERSDSGDTVRLSGHVSLLNENVTSTWRNRAAEDARILIIEFVKR